MLLKSKPARALLAALGWLFGAWMPALAEVPQTAASSASEEPAMAERIRTDHMTDAKLKAVLDRIERKRKMSNPQRADQPHEAVAFYVNKRTGPILTRGPNKTVGMRKLDTRLYLDALAALRGPAHAGKTIGAPAMAAAPGSLLGTWNNLGPTNQGGRTRQLLIDPSNANIMYAAAVGGGVWKSTDGGGNWNQLTDLVLPNIAVSSLAMDPSNPQVLYAGTGEGFFNSDAIAGAGMFKTIDGGATWSPLTATTAGGVRAADFRFVTQIAVSARYPQRIYATTRTGLFRSNDGGTSWTRLIDGSSVNGCMDVVIQQKRAVGYVFAACGTFANSAIHRALDGPSTAFTQVFTTTGMGRTSLAIAPSNESYVYALASSNGPGPYANGMLGVYRSTTNGATGSWTTQVSNTSPTKLNTLLLTNPVYAYSECVGTASAGLYNQGWYDNVIAVDPVNPEVVWAGGVDMMRSDDGGRTWGIASYWWFDIGDANYAHADKHVIRFHPGYDGVNNKKMFLATDGGIFRTDDATGAVGKTIANVCGIVPAGMVTWTELNNNYATTQFYHGAVYPNGNTYIGGMQDNGTWRGTTASTQWTKLLGGDGGYAAVDTKGDLNPANDVLFGEFTGLSIQRSTDGGATFSDAVNGITESASGFLFIAPFAMNEAARNQLWTGGFYIWRTLDQGTSWQRASGLTPGNGSVAAIAASPQDGNRVIVGMSDGYIAFTTTGLTSGATTAWAFTRPRTVFVSAIAFDPNNVNVAYATYATFSGNSVYKTVNGGASWTPMPGTGANTLPQVPATAVVVDPADGNRVYVGTDIGVFTSNDGGTNWVREYTGFGNVSVEHLAINSEGTRRLYAFTHGRGAWRVDLNP